MNLTLDFGNTRAKACVFDGAEAVFERAYEAFSESDCLSILSSYPISAAAACSVLRDEPPALSLLRSRSFPFIMLGPDTPLPFKIGYETPRTLGTDRLAAAAGAYARMPGRNLLVIDLGTAITYDLLTADGTFFGGNIAPGAALRFRSLNEHTGRLPLLSLAPFDGLLGRDTESAILGGVAEGITAEIGHYSVELQKRFGELFVFLTGGDCFYFAKRLKMRIFVSPNPNLLSEGLNSVLNYNLCRKSES